MPKSPCNTFRYPAGNHVATYENNRPNVMEEFKGRIDDYSHRHDSTERN